MRLLFHGIPLSVEGDARALAAAAELLGLLPVNATPGDPGLRLVLRRGPPRPRPVGPRILYHGIVDCHADGADLLLWDGHSTARISAGGARVEVEVADASLRDGYLFAHVLLFISLVLALRWRGIFHLHAGALVAPDGGGILVSGPAGAGKSTLTLALLEAGCACLGDDAVFLSFRPGEPAVLAFPRPFHVAPRTAEAFPRIAALLDDFLPSGEKRRLDPRRAWPGRERATIDQPATLLLPCITGAPGTVVEPVGSAEALGELVESSAFVVVDGLPGGREHLAALTRIADEARAWRVGMGRDVLDSPVDVASSILARVAGRRVAG
jgi:hypothetical protein